MQRNRRHKQSVKNPLVSTPETLPEKVLSQPITEERVRQIFEELFNKMMLDASSQNNIAHSTEQKLPPRFIPFAKWKKDKDTREELYTQLARYSYVNWIKDDHDKPDFITSDSQSLKLIWLKNLTVLIYILYHLEKTYDAIFLVQSIAITIHENFLIQDKKSKKLVSPDLDSLRTECSRILPLIESGRRKYPAIDDILRDIFNKGQC